MSKHFIASTKYGKVRGVEVTSAVGIPYIRFLGIPYAKPPVGELRFQNPIKLESWEGVYDTLVEPSPCAGKNNYLKKFIGSDDCLYMNIYTKNLNPEKKCATIVFIHGGGFTSGSSTLYSYSPDYILMSDVVLVIFNYRYGPLGFANFHDKSLNIPGNACMKDQQMAMRFVKDNIESFGGDPNNITLMGHSAGASCVGLHCIAESSKGLFNKAIIMSGSEVGMECVLPQLNWTKKLAVKMGYEGDFEDEKKILNFLNQVDVINMVETAKDLVTMEEMLKYGILIPFTPHREAYPTSSAFLLESPEDLQGNAWGNDIDIMIGGAKDEGLIYKKNYEIYTPKPLKPHENRRKAEVAYKAKEYYEKLFTDKEEALVEYTGDTVRWIDMIRTIKSRLSSNGKGKTFFYSFWVDSPTKNHYRNRYFGEGSKGVVHADELGYLWHNGYSQVPPRDSMEFRCIKKFVSIITSFAINGNPNNPELGNVLWEPVEKEPYKMLIIDEEDKVEESKVAKRVLEFWKELFEKYGAKF